MDAKLSYLETGAAVYRGLAAEQVDFTMNRQLLDADTWKKFVEVFRADSDIHDNGWRCEYFGKMMRGACLTYLYNGSKELYKVLEDCVRDILTTPRPDGRISTYSSDHMLCGWDMWGRKYVITGCLHFYRICTDEALKEEILRVLKAHADAVLATVGSGEGKTEIVTTSDFWGGVNSCSILEPMLDLYRVTGEKRYLEFGEYIISTGGCIDGNLVELAHEGKVMPYQYPEVKAYETISFFEGLLAYYELTGKTYYLETVQKFIEAVAETDITVIGCAGCTHELFDHSAEVQTEPSEAGIMQETCVTVTWMRMLARLLLLTGEPRYYDRLERAGWNALYGAVNQNQLKQLDRFNQVWLDPLPFDSYSPLYNSTRGIGIGGLKHFSFGGYYGCCACIAAAGIALVPLTAVLRTEKGLLFNELLEGTVNTLTPAGQKLQVEISSSFPARMNSCLVLNPEKPEEFTLTLRVPSYCLRPVLHVAGKQSLLAPVDGRIEITRVWNPGDRVVFTADYALTPVELNGKTAFEYGPLVMARDAHKEEITPDLTETVTLAKPLAVRYAYPRPEDQEQVRLRVKKEDGSELLLTDYASCGKHWLDENNRMSVWMNLA